MVYRLEQEGMQAHEVAGKKISRLSGRVTAISTAQLR
jgi:hypothetical protein